MTNARIYFGICLTLVIGLANSAPAQEATTQPDAGVQAPTTRPARQFRSRRFQRRQDEQSSIDAPVLPTLWEQVGLRNIFVRGDQSTPEPVYSPPGTTPPPQPYENTPQATQLVLTGVSITDIGKIALLENRDEFTVIKVKVGDPIADGTVVNITLDALDYKDSRGRIIRVSVGFNLAGGDVWGSGGASGTGSSPGTSTQPSRTGPRQPGESMEDYLRRRRQEELNH